MGRKSIDVVGARQNNLRGVDVSFPLGAITAVTGVSGSGKSSLAFDTLYAEGQRRYVESFSPYARQFMDRMDRPDVARVDGVLPAVAIDQKNAIRASRSTVGTITELCDFIKVLYARAATLSCCGAPVLDESPAHVAAALCDEHDGARAIIAFSVPATTRRARELALEWLAAEGYQRLVQEGEAIPLAERKKSSRLPIIVALDRVTIEAKRRGRLSASVEQAMMRAGGQALVYLDGQREPRVFSRGRHCPRCDTRYPAPLESHFSFNSPLGACETCNGFGAVIDLDLDLVIPDRSLSLDEGAVRCWNTERTEYERGELCGCAEYYGIATDKPWGKLADDERELLIEGDKRRAAPARLAKRVDEPYGFFGIRGWFRWLERKTYKMHVRVLLSRYRAYVPCEACGGARLNAHALKYTLGGLSLDALYAMSIGEARAFFDTLELDTESAGACKPVLTEVRERLRYLCDVGVDYLTLDRKSRTLSGGEVQRVNLTTAIGSALVNTLYVLDEPSIGLHARDNARLMAILERLRDNRNTIVVVEHDDAIIRRTDHVVDLGPGPGDRGGEVVYAGPTRGLARAKDRSLTARYLSRAALAPTQAQWFVDDDAATPKPRRPVNGKTRRLSLSGARAHNLRGVDIEIPLERLTIISGVSGSGKSTLACDVLFRGLARLRGVPTERPGEHDRIEGARYLSDVVLVDQSPVGTTPRSNAATYVKVYDGIRKHFAATSAATRAGLSPASFSFNVAGGRCEACDGNGFERVEMQFLSDQFVACEKCGGKRFKPEVLAVELDGRSIADVLELTVDEAREVFADDDKIARGLAALSGVGLGYLRLGQPLNTLSGGESQRLKLAGHLAVDRTRGALFIFDEPTTGLHLADVQRLIENLHALVDVGNTVVVIEHHLDVIAQADWIIDLGPEGGREGGELLVCGPLDELLESERSHTARYLRAHLAGDAELDAIASAGRASEAKRSYLAPADIVVRGARVNNLRELDITLPRDKLVVVTGPSGSGKSSLAFDVLFAEGQRRFIDCLSPYARQYVAQVGRPDLDELLGVPPTVCISQRTARGGRKSTVATVTEIYHYLRLIYARVGVQHCHHCGAQVSGLSDERISALLIEHHDGQRVRVLAPAVRGRKGFHKDIFKRARARDHGEVRVDRSVLPLEPQPELSRYDEHDVEYVVGEVVVSAKRRAEIEALVGEALELGDGTLYVLPHKRRRVRRYSRDRYCADCGLGFDPPDPRTFSFNSRAGACEACGGSGVEPGGDEDGDETIDESLDGGSISTRLETPCSACGGARLSPRARAVRVFERSIDELTALTPGELVSVIEQAPLGERERAIVGTAVDEVTARCRFLERVGLGYLELGRGAHTLSGGEAQRVRLAAQLSAELRGVLYVLDEPTIGLHPHDNQRLLETLEELVTRGNTVVVVEHDEETIRRADHLVDMGEGGGSHGGRIVAAGPRARVLKQKRCLTARCMAIPGAERAVYRGRDVGRRAPSLAVSDVTHHNLAGVRARFPLGCLTVVTGVSGSGKSSLVRDVLGEGLRRVLHGGAGLSGTLRGTEAIRHVREIDQSPIGKTPASTPATYVGIYDEIRRLFAQLPEARARGYSAGRFSFNVRGGRCEHCSGKGSVKHEMSFLPDVYVHCELCDGARYAPETLEVRYREHSIADVLALTVEQARELFEAVPKVRRPLELLNDVGLGYVQLGQPSNTLSGGEAQRVKLARELQKRGGTRAGESVLYIMDEPSTGLHFDDLRKLLDVMQRLVDRGDTLVVIEHNLDVIASADYVIDLGPGGGKHGGRVLYQGPRDGLCGKDTATARFLAEHLGHAY
ncbi:MAG: excinuclease ABC subunit UvrA [Myxococcales bacterium]|nr:excinuclease ABC subunit UvrA [Myxococcales bacterium]